LPFLCWGSSGTPGHAHTNAHWIFAEPNHSHSPQHATAENYLQMMKSSRRHLHTVAEVMAGHTHLCEAAVIQRLEQVVGLQDETTMRKFHLDLRATAELSAASLLLMLLLGIATIQRSFLRHFPFKIPPILSQQVTLQVPIPPPRVTALLCA